MLVVASVHCRHQCFVGGYKMTTLDKVLTLLPQLSLAERVHVLEVLEADPQVATQRMENQAALAHLDSRVAADNDEDDSWWETFAKAIDSDRTSNRPLYAGQSSRST
jgi:hypothetical protein